MKLKTFILTAVLFLPVSAVHGSVGAHDGQWTGLWAITQRTQNGPQEFYLFVPASKPPVFYGPNWAPLSIAEIRVEGESFLLNWQATSSNTLFEGSRRQDRISGKWQLAHPQFSDKGNFSARKILAVSDWSPLGGIGAGPVVNLNALLAEHSGDLDGYWTRTFRPDYLALLEPDLNPSQLRPKLQSSDFAARSDQLAATLEEVIRQLRSKLDGFKLSPTVVLLPIGDADRFRFVVVQDRSFFLLNPERFLSEPPGRENVARRLLSALTEIQFEGQHVSLSLIRAGLPAHALVRLGYAGDAREALNLSEAEWTSLNERLPEIKVKIAAKRNLTDAEEAVAGFDFVAFLSGDRSFDEIFGAPTAELIRELSRYLTS